MRPGWHSIRTRRRMRNGIERTSCPQLENPWKRLAKRRKCNENNGEVIPPPRAGRNFLGGRKYLLRFELVQTPASRKALREPRTSRRNQEACPFWIFSRDSAAHEKCVA